MTRTICKESHGWPYIRLHSEREALRAANNKLADDNKMLLDANRSLNSALINVRHQIQNVEEREAACCPEDVGFDEYIKVLRAQLYTLEAEIDAACKAACKHCRENNPGRYSANTWEHNLTGMSWYCEASGIRERRYQRLQGAEPPVSQQDRGGENE